MLTKFRSKTRVTDVIFKITISILFQRFKKSQFETGINDLKNHNLDPDQRPKKITIHNPEKSVPN